MMKFILNWIQNAVNSMKGIPFDPASLQDPLALKTAWTPVKSGGTNIVTHRLHASGHMKLLFKPAFGALFFYGIFLFVGIGLVLFTSFALFSKSSGFDPSLLPITFLGFVFALVGFVMFRSGTVPIVFDKTRMLYWKGRPLSGESPRTLQVKEKCELSNIHALQILSEHCRGSKSSYTSYELNLVLKDGSRINVVDHGSIRLLRLDAGKLGEFLNVPVWDSLGDRRGSTPL